MEEPETPTVEEGYEFGGWYLDEECTIPADFNSIQGVTLYPKIEEDYPTANLPSDWLAWDSNTSSYYVTGGSSTLPADVVVPKTYNDGTNGEANVTYIGDSAFQMCDGLTSITLPSSVTSIGEYSFYYCGGLTSVDLTQSTSLTSIGIGAFSECSRLISLDLSQCSSLTSIGEYAFQACMGLTSINLPSSVTSIGSGAFQFCTGLTSIDLSKCTSLTSIGNDAFYYCKGLTSITIPANVTKIGKSAFNNCTNLTSITFSDKSTWYRTNSSTNWNNMTGGTSTSVSNASTNATYFTDTYENYYWYKK
ncbi:MAG: leucine-rich repeat domain-containing protein [Clostridia bacterium]|nr:leucine-rich repeat domain-containing protein [Clostridia bacterium]